MTAWMLTIKSNPRYSSNDGYDNIPDQKYVFDSNVQNHKAIKSSDVVIVRVDDKIIGISNIENKNVKKDSKKLNECPECGSKKIRSRKTISPKWVCENHHFFNEPKTKIKNIKRFEILYGKNFQSLSQPIQWQILFPYFSNTATQSIRKINLRSLLNANDQAIQELQEQILFVGDGKQGAFELNQSYPTGDTQKQHSGFSEFSAVSDEINESQIYSSSWTGKRSITELASQVTTLCPIVINELNDWIHYLEYERNDPTPPEGMPDDLLEQLKLLHLELGELIALGNNNPDKITSKKIQRIAKLVRNTFRPRIENGQFFIAGMGRYGMRITGGLACVKIIETITGLPITIDSGATATVFAAGVAAATYGNVSKK